jgi:hypothetical protein
VNLSMPSDIGIFHTFPWWGYWTHADNKVTVSCEFPGKVRGFWHGFGQVMKNRLDDINFQIWGNGECPSLDFLQGIDTLVISDFALDCLRDLIIENCEIIRVPQQINGTNYYIVNPQTIHAHAAKEVVISLPPPRNEYVIIEPDASYVKSTSYPPHILCSPKLINHRPVLLSSELVLRIISHKLTGIAFSQFDCHMTQKEFLIKGFPIKKHVKRKFHSI